MNQAQRKCASFGDRFTSYHPASTRRNQNSHLDFKASVNSVRQHWIYCYRASI